MFVSIKINKKIKNAIYCISNVKRESQGNRFILIEVHKTVFLLCSVDFPNFLSAGLSSIVFRLRIHFRWPSCPGNSPNSLADCYVVHICMYIPTDSIYAIMGKKQNTKIPDLKKTKQMQ